MRSYESTGQIINEAPTLRKARRASTQNHLVDKRPGGSQGSSRVGNQEVAPRSFPLLTTSLLNCLTAHRVPGVQRELHVPLLIDFDSLRQVNQSEGHVLLCTLL
jgi:hypothetical protein